MERFKGLVTICSQKPWNNPEVGIHYSLLPRKTQWQVRSWMPIWFLKGKLCSKTLHFGGCSILCFQGKPDCFWERTHCGLRVAWSSLETTRMESDEMKRWFVCLIFMRRCLYFEMIWNQNWPVSIEIPKSLGRYCRNQPRWWVVDVQGLCIALLRARW